MWRPEPPLLSVLSHLCDSLSGPERRRLMYLCGSLEDDCSPVSARDVLESAVCHRDRPRDTLREMLLHLRRLDLLRTMFHCERSDVERQSSSVSQYRVLMLDLSDDMTRENLDQFKFLLGRDLPRDRLDRAQSFLDVVVELEKQGQVSSENLDLIETGLRDVGRVDLSRRVRTFTAPDPSPAQVYRGFQGPLSNHQQTRLGQTLPPMQTPPPQQWCRSVQTLDSHRLIPTRHEQLLQNAHDQTQIQRCRPLQATSALPPQTRHTQLLQNGASLTALQREKNSANSIDRYRMNTNPRGVCVIFDCVGHDGELLKQTFLSLSFSVVLHRLLSVSECQSALRALRSDAVLRQASAFVCCVISRGTELHLLATDARCYGLHLDALRQMFTPKNCPALAGKPKLFFIQRYSVQERQSGTESSYGHSEDLETDGPGHGPGHCLVPTDADVFWSHCWTNESQLQKSGHNSQYLRALVEALQAALVRKWHVVDLHIRVNAAICEHNQRNPTEQYHLELRHTLTKNLYLD